MAQTSPGKQLNDLLITRNFNPEALDASGRPAPTPDEATVFSFDYTGESGKDYGTVAILLGDGNDMCVYFGDNVGKSMEGDDKKEWFDFLYQLRQFSKRNLLSFSLQNLNKLKYSMQGQAAIKEGIFESWAGKRDVSYNADATQARLMIKHKKNLGEQDARFRYIESLFIETTDGERYKMPFKSLSAGKAMLEHVRQGGRPYDARGQHIATIVEEMALLARFKRANQGRIFEGETAQLVEQATEHYTNLHQTLKSLSNKTGYKKYFENWNPAELSDEDVIIEDLRHMFIEQNIDSRIEQALPLLARLKQETAMKEINVFEGMMDLIIEGTWAVPDTEEKQQKLVALLSNELPVGPDAGDVTEQLYDVFGDDKLFDQLGELAQQDANADARTVILNRLEELKNNSAIAQVIGQLKTASNPAPAEQPVQEQLRESAGDVMFKDQERLDRLENLRMFARAVGNTSKAEELDRQIKAIYAANPVGSQDAGHLEEFTEASDTVKLGPDGKPEAWSHEGDWEKVKRVNGKPVDPRGEVTNMTGQELNKAKQIAGLNEEDSPVAAAITRRIMMQRSDLLATYGPQSVMAAIDNVADYVGDVDEIGSSDVSGWINEVERMLKENPPEAFAEEQVDELSPDTLKSYIKRAGSSSHKNSASNLASRAADKLAQAHNPGVEDDGYDDDHKSYLRSKGIAKAVDRLEEGGMSEVDLTLQEIARGNVDIYDIYANPKSNVEKFVSDQIHDRVEQLTKERPELRHELDIEKVLGIIKMDLEDDYGIAETVGGGNWLEEGNMVYDPITKKMVPTKRAKVKMGGGYRKTDPATGKVIDSSDPSEIGKHKDELEESTALTGQYGHSGKLQAVEPQDADMMDRIKFLAGVTK